MIHWEIIEQAVFWPHFKGCVCFAKGTGEGREKPIC